MDAALHPVVQRGILVAELMSDALYREDWNEEKDLIYYPVQVTPGYESATNAQKFASNKIYTKKHEETKLGCQFMYAHTSDLGILIRKWFNLMN